MQRTTQHEGGKGGNGGREAEADAESDAESVDSVDSLDEVVENATTGKTGPATMPPESLHSPVGTTSAGTSGMTAGTSRMSEYEMQRQHNIQNNKRMLAQLGLEDKTHQDTTATRRRAGPATSRHSNSRQQPQQPLRQSGRLLGQQHQINYYESPL